MAQVSYGTITITDTTDIDSIKNWYLATSASSGVTKETSGWTSTIQQMTTDKQYLWNYEQILGTGGVEISSTQPVIIGRYGKDGTNGTNGADGNSITSIDEYYQITNSTSNPGSNGWSKNTLVVPTSTNKYLWNYQVINYSKTSAEGSYTDARIIGVYGDTGPQGPQGNPGTAGINTATVYLYQRATSMPSKPSGNLTYTFASAEITSGTLGSWKQSIGDLSGTDPIWVIAAVASSNGTTDTIASTEWSTQIKLAQNGTNGTNGTNGIDGLNQATVYIYKRGDSVTKPNNSTYTFSTGDFTLSDNTWSKTIPSTPAGKPCWVSSAIAIGNGTTATLAWNTPSVLVEDGTNGISPTVTSTSTGVKIVDAAGNTTYINNGSNGQSYYTYIRYATDSSGSGMSSSPTGKTYIGVYSGTSSTAPTTANSYTWSKYVGDPGTPATQYYAFVKYATDVNGTGMQDSPDSTHIYVGTYTGTDASPTASAYKWSKYVGENGQSATQYYAFIKYATSSSGANMTDTPTSNTTYVGTYSGTKSSPTASDYKWSEYVGADGVSVTSVRELYWLKTNSTNPSQITWNSSTSQPSQTIYSTDRTNSWTSIVPTYVTNGTYYTCIETTLSSGTKVWSAPVQNIALTDANSKATEALTQVTAIQETVDATEANMAALQSRLKKIWINEVTDGDYVAGTYAASGIENVTFEESNPQTYGYNTLLRHNKLALRYNTIDMTALTTNALTFYIPTQENDNWIQGEKGLEITTDGIDLYNPSGNKGLEITSNGIDIFGEQETKGLSMQSGGLIIYDPSETSSNSISLIAVQQTGFSLGYDADKLEGLDPYTTEIEEPFMVWQKAEDGGQDTHNRLYIYTDDIILRINDDSSSTQQLFLKDKLSQIDNNILANNQAINTNKQKIQKNENEISVNTQKIVLNEENIDKNTADITSINNKLIKIKAYWTIDSDNHLTLIEGILNG